jgi:formamidopyrimidine-DNA glycosylase
MPELPEVETVRTAINETVSGDRINTVNISNKKMRWPIPTTIHERVAGAMLKAARRRGKYILIDITTQQSDIVMLIHLGMSGSIRIYDRVQDAGAKGQHDHMLVDFTSGKRLVLTDPRRFGGVDLTTPEQEAAHPLLKNMGIEPLGNRLDGDFLRQALKGKKTSIKNALLDQRILAGIGNIYATEALFLASIHPARKAGQISTERYHDLAQSIRQVLETAIRAGGTSLRDHVQPGGEIGYFTQELSVYGREACPHCATLVRRIRQSGRASYYCPQCQH